MKFCWHVVRGLCAILVALTMAACGSEGDHSAAGLDPRSSAIEINETGVDDGADPSGAGDATSGGSFTEEEGGTSSSSTSSTSSTSGSGSTSGDTGGSGMGEEGATSTSSTGSASNDTPPPPVSLCGNDETESLVNFECRMSAVTIPGNVSCVFQDSDGPFGGKVQALFVPAAQGARGCVAVSPDSVLAKVGNLPTLSRGQYRFSGTLKACLPKAGVSRAQTRALAIFEFMSNLASDPREGRVLDTSAHRGKRGISLDSQPGTPKSEYYCPG